MNETNTQAPWTSLDYAVVDVEGNGQQPPDLVELAVAPISAGIIGTPSTWLVRPPRPITATARRFHHISDQDAASAPTVADIANDMHAILDGKVFVAHNAPVDLAVLTRALPSLAPTHVIDTLKLARRWLPGRGSYKLGALVAAFDLADTLPCELAPHRATYDALACARLLTHLAAPPNRPERTVGDLLDQTTKTVRARNDDSTPSLF